MLTKEKINKTIENFAHFTFKVSNSNALSGGLRRKKDRFRWIYMYV